MLINRETLITAVLVPLNIYIYIYIYIYMCVYMHIHMSISVYTHIVIIYDIIKLLMSMNVYVSCFYSTGQK